MKITYTFDTETDDQWDIETFDKAREYRVALSNLDDVMRGMLKYDDKLPDCCSELLVKLRVSVRDELEGVPL